MSLLQANGHPLAHHYALCVVSREADLVRRRVNQQLRTQAIVIQSAYLGAKSKKAHKLFEKLLESFSDGKAG